MPTSAIAMPPVGSDPVVGRSRPTVASSADGPRREPDERSRRATPGATPSTTQPSCEHGDGDAGRECDVDGRGDGLAPGRAEQHEPDDLDEAEDARGPRSPRAPRARSRPRLRRGHRRRPGRAAATAASATRTRSRSAAAARRSPSRRPGTRRPSTASAAAARRAGRARASPTARSNAPAPRKRSALKSAWLSVWSSAAASANAAHVSAPRARSSRQAPRPSTMIPTFSIEWNASSRFRSCWKSAYVDARHGRERPDREHEHAEPLRQDTEPVDEHAHEPVDRDLDHHAAHQRRDLRGRDRVGTRKPDVQRHQTGLRTHPDERSERDRDLHARARERSRSGPRSRRPWRAGGSRSTCRRRRGA